MHCCTIFITSDKAIVLFGVLPVCLYPHYRQCPSRVKLDMRHSHSMLREVVFKALILWTGSNFVKSRPARTTALHCCFKSANCDQETADVSCYYSWCSAAKYPFWRFSGRRELIVSSQCLLTPSVSRPGKQLYFAWKRDVNTMTIACCVITGDVFVCRLQNDHCCKLCIFLNKNTFLQFWQCCAQCIVGDAVVFGRLSSDGALTQMSF